MHRDREISASFPTDSIPMGGVGCDRVMSSGDAHVVDLGQQRLASLPRSRGDTGAQPRVVTRDGGAAPRLAALHAATPR